MSLFELGNRGLLALCMFVLLAMMLNSMGSSRPVAAPAASANTTTATNGTANANANANADDCDKCGPTRLIGCRSGRCYYKCTRRCLGKDNKFYYEAVKFNFAGQR